MSQHRIHVDIEDEEVFSQLKIGDEVEVTFRGPITSLEAAREYAICCSHGEGEETEKYPPELGLEVKSTRVRVRSNDFSELDRSADEDM